MPWENDGKLIWHHKYNCLPKKKVCKDHVATVQLFLFAFSLMLCSLLLRKCEEV